MSLAGISPFGPIFSKELRIASRRKRNHLLRLLYLGGLLLFLLSVWSSMRYEYDYNGGVAAKMQHAAELGRGFFITFSMFCVICMGLIAPVLTSTAIGSERLAKTLPVLLMTPITSWQIVSGKLFSRMLIVLMLIGLSLPVLALVRLLGGVDLWQMMAVIGICVCFALAAAALGLFYSTLLNRSYAVILLSYGTMMLIYLLVPILLSIGVRSSSPPGSGFYYFLAAINPVFNVAIISIPDSPAFATQSVAMYLPGMLVHLLATVILLILSAAMIRRIARNGGEKAAQVAIVLAPPPLPQAQPVNDGSLPPPSLKDRPVSDNPVLWREIRRPMMKRVLGVLLAFAIVILTLVTYGFLASADALKYSESQIGYALGFNAMFWLLLAVLSSTSIAQEKESDTWTLLLATSISGRDIVVGKLLGLLRRMLWPSVFIFIHFTIFLLAGVITFAAYFVVLWTIVSFNTVWAATGIFFSLRLRKPTTAIILNLMMAIVLFCAVPLVLTIIGELSRNRHLFESVCWYLPYFYLVQALDVIRPERTGRMLWLPWHGNEPQSLSTFLNVVFFIGLAHIALAWLIILATCRWFDRLVGRAEQKG